MVTNDPICWRKKIIISKCWGFYIEKADNFTFIHIGWLEIVIHREGRMPDISMCVKDGNECPRKDKCYRYLATPSFRQSYSNFWKEKQFEDCKYFWQEEK